MFSSATTATTRQYTLDGFHNNIYFLTVMEAGNPRFAFSGGLSPCPANIHLLALFSHGLFSACKYPWGLLFFLQGHQSYWIRVPHIWPLITFITSLKALPPNKVTSGVELQHRNRGGGKDTIQSMIIIQSGWKEQKICIWKVHVLWALCKSCNFSLSLPKKVTINSLCQMTCNYLTHFFFQIVYGTFYWQNFLLAQR